LFPKTPSKRAEEELLKTDIMPTLHVKQGSALELQQIADNLARSKKVVVVTGAGISTNCGIPVSGSQSRLYFYSTCSLITGLSLRGWPLLANSSSIQRIVEKSSLGTI
jgi:hypothetical protein